MTPESDRTHSLTVRLPKDLYLAAKGIAARRRKSMNVVIQESLQHSVESDEQEELRRSFELLSDSPRQCSVDYAFDAQREVVLSDEP